MFCDSYTVLVTARKWTIWSQAISFERLIRVCLPGVWSYRLIAAKAIISAETGYVPYFALIVDIDFKDLSQICYKYGI